MKQVGVFSTGVLLLLLGSVAPTYAQDRHEQEAQAPRQEEQAKPEKQAKTEKQPKPEKQAKAEKQPKPEKQAKAEKQPKPEKQAKVEKQPKPEKQAKAEKPSKPEKQAKAEKQPKPEKQAKVEKQPKPEKQAKAEKQPKPEKQPKVEKQQAKEQQKQQKEQQKEAKGQQKHENPENQTHAMSQQQGGYSPRPERTPQEQARQRGEPALRLSARGEGRIPDDRFRSNFGREHAFSIGSPQIVDGYSRFQYGGFWFGFVQEWPSDWYYTDDVYIDYVDGGYYMYDPYYPGVRVEICVVL